MTSSDRPPVHTRSLSASPGAIGGPQKGVSWRSHGVRWGREIAVGLMVSVAAGGTLWVQRPFQAQIASYRTSLADRTEAQRHNIRQAVMALDGVVIEPGETFSFNETVGPRLPERGYREAPAYMERNLVTSIGGGICQVSSTMYNAAALSGLAIVERHPHSRRVASVPPGRDATVWYGMADLRFRNSYPNPVRLAVKVANEALFVAVWVRRATGQEILLRTETLFSPLGHLTFETVRTTTTFGKQDVNEILSLDVYSN